MPGNYTEIAFESAIENHLLTKAGYIASEKQNVRFHQVSKVHLKNDTDRFIGRGKGAF